MYIKWLVFLVCLAVLLAPDVSNAYLDAGTGSYFFQILIAGSVGLIFSLKSFWRSVFSFIQKRFKSSRTKPAGSSVSNSPNPDQRREG